MGIAGKLLQEMLDRLGETDPAIAAAISRVGYPEPRIRPRGYATLLRTIIGQQVSVSAANAIWTRLEALLGGDFAPEKLTACEIDHLRTAGLSRQKASYAHSLAEAVTSGHVDFAQLPDDDEEAIRLLQSIKGIGRWSAEIYLLFAEGRTDIWPAGDLAVQIELGRIKGLTERPTEKQTRLLAEEWRPYRGAAAIFLWHHYGASKLPL